LYRQGIGRSEILMRLDLDFKTAARAWETCWSGVFLVDIFTYFLVILFSGKGKEFNEARLLRAF
jgi:hypothetical protein